MARARSIKPGFFANEQLASLDPLARILFAGLWTLADREGRMEDRPKRIKALCLPYDDCDVDALLDALAAGRDPFVVRYEIDGQKYLQVVKWKQHQSPHVREPDSVIPPCTPKPGKHRARTRQAPAEPVGSVNGESAVKEEGQGKGEGGTRAREKFAPPTVAEVAAYCRERDNGIDAQSFVDFYTSKGWRVGNTPMRDWQASVRTWERNHVSRGSPSQRDPRGNLALRDQLLSELQDAQ